MESAIEKSTRRWCVRKGMFRINGLGVEEVVSIFNQLLCIRVLHHFRSKKRERGEFGEMR